MARCVLKIVKSSKESELVHYNAVMYCMDEQQNRPC